MHFAFLLYLFILLEFFYTQVSYLNLKQLLELKELSFCNEYISEYSNLQTSGSLHLNCPTLTSTGICFKWVTFWCYATDFIKKMFKKKCLCKICCFIYPMNIVKKTSHILTQYFSTQNIVQVSWALALFIS